MTLGAATGYAQTVPLNLKVYNADAAGFQAAYPTAGLDIALDIGAKVGKGEMKW